MPIDPSFAVTGGDWQIGGIGSVGGAGSAPGASGADGASGSSFGSALANQIGRLDALQQDAATASQQLATGQATDPSTTVMTIERARLAMQLASQIRTKGVEALQDVFRTSV
jgi:flagellar hook-basal body complex protein FliE